VSEEEGVHQVEDWAEVRRLHEREGLSQAAIARRLGMSRNTVARLPAEISARLGCVSSSNAPSS
jgi:DNA-binding transcriptional regulator LsrR (DeoR family)